MEILAVQAMRVLDTETTWKGDVVKKSPSFVIPLSVITVLATALLLSNKARPDQTSESTGHPSKPYQTNVLVYTVDYANQTNTYRDMMAHKSDIGVGRCISSPKRWVPQRYSPQGNRDPTLCLC
jgi:hypothetical protein